MIHQEYVKDIYIIYIYIDLRFILGTTLLLTMVTSRSLRSLRLSKLQAAALLALGASPLLLPDCSRVMGACLTKWLVNGGVNNNLI